MLMQILMIINFSRSRSTCINVRMSTVQCSPQTKWKAYWESIFWVELVSTSKLETPTQTHNKGILALKGYGANIL